MLCSGTNYCQVLAICCQKTLHSCAMVTEGSGKTDFVKKDFSNFLHYIKVQLHSQTLGFNWSLNTSLAEFIKTSTSTPAVLHNLKETSGNKVKKCHFDGLLSSNKF